MGAWLFTAEIFEAFLKCRTKSYLFGTGVAVEESATGIVRMQLENAFRRDAGVALRATAAEGQLDVGTPPIEEIRRRKYSLIVDGGLSTANLSAEFDGLRLVARRPLTTDIPVCYRKAIGSMVLMSMAKHVDSPTVPPNIDIRIRTHSREQVAQIAAAIREWGWTNPILVEPDGLLLAGDGRLAAAKKLKMKEVPVIPLAHLTPAQRRALVIADNQLALNAGWDEETLRIELAALHEEDYNLGLLGIEDVELQRLLEAQDAAPFLTDADAVPDLQPDPVARLGDCLSSETTA